MKRKKKGRRGAKSSILGASCMLASLDEAPTAIEFGATAPRRTMTSACGRGNSGKRKKIGRLSSFPVHAVEAGLQCHGRLVRLLRVQTQNFHAVRIPRVREKVSSS